MPEIEKFYLLKLIMKFALSILALFLVIFYIKDFDILIKCSLGFFSLMFIYDVVRFIIHKNNRIMRLIRILFTIILLLNLTSLLGKTVTIILFCIWLLGYIWYRIFKGKLAKEQVLGSGDVYFIGPILFMLMNEFIISFLSKTSLIIPIGSGRCIDNPTCIVYPGWPFQWGLAAFLTIYLIGLSSHLSLFKHHPFHIEEMKFNSMLR